MYTIVKMLLRENYFEYNKDPNQQIYVIERLELATGKVQRVTGGSGGAIRPTPSPDGDTLAFCEEREIERY